MSDALRTKETRQKYHDYQNNYVGDGTDHFADWRERIIKEYNFWVIVENYYPFDKVARTHHLLITKRIVAFDWKMLNNEELAELEIIKGDNKGLYDSLVENLPKNQSIPKHFHLHFMTYKKEI